MNKIPYSFSVLRYVHDPVSQEFANVGVALYSKQARYLTAICTVNYGRITNMFGSIDGNKFRQTTRYIQDRLESLGDELSNKLPFESKSSFEAILAMVLPRDDSAFQFSRAGSGISENLDAELRSLFARFVERYSADSESTPRDDDEVWKQVYREPLVRRQVIQYLEPKQIVAPNFDYVFEHSWKNESWHVYEPISFDLLQANTILDKANRWLGRVATLIESKEKFKLYVLLGEPKDSRLKSAFVKAQNILNKMPGDHELVREDEAEQFADEVSHEVREHGPDYE